MGLYKSRSGLYFEDTFRSLNDRWKFSSENYSLGIDYLRLIQSDVECFALFDLPAENNIVIDIYSDFAPQDNISQAGLLVWRNSYERLELLKDLDLAEEDFIGFRTVKENGLWSFYGIQENGIKFIDKTEFLGAISCGFILKQGNIPFDVKRVLVSLGDSLKIRNILPGQVVELYDSESVLIESKVVPDDSNGLDFTLSTMPLNGRVILKDELSNELDNLETIFSGGDVYESGSYLQVLKDGQELSTTDLTNLGIMRNGVLEIPLQLFNPKTETTATNINIFTEQYETKFGYQWVTINGLESLSLGFLNPLGLFDFTIKVEQSDDYSGPLPLFFNLGVDHR